MCSGVDYRCQGRRIRAYVPNPRAKLPVLLRSGEDRLLPWGRHEGNQDAYLLVDGRARRRYAEVYGLNGIRVQYYSTCTVGWNTPTISGWASDEGCKNRGSLSQGE
jgi:hypothetical protein